MDELNPKKAAVAKNYYTSHGNLEQNLPTAIDADSFAKRSQKLKGFTVFDYIDKCWLNEPDRFERDTRHMFAEPKPQLYYGNFNAY